MMSHLIFWMSGGVRKSFIVSLLILSSLSLEASPLKMILPTQQLKTVIKRSKGSKILLPEGLKARIVQNRVQWNYIPSSGISIPVIDIQFEGIPSEKKFTLLIDHSTELKPNSSQIYVHHMPLLKLDDNIHLTVVDEYGSYEDWLVQLHTDLSETAIFVDETCGDYAFRIRELSRGNLPNLIFVGCQAGSHAGEVNFQIVWSGTDHLFYSGKMVTVYNSVLTLPVRLGMKQKFELSGLNLGGEKSSYEVEFETNLESPYKILLGIGGLLTSFSQSNFPSKYTQLSSGIFGSFWYAPEQMPLSFVMNGFASLFSLSQKFDPDLGYQESVQTLFFDVAMRYSVFKGDTWQIDPFLGAWFYFMSVKSMKYGVQKAIDPMVGLFIRKDFASANSFVLALKAVPLLEYFDPSQVSSSKLYSEINWMYLHFLKQKTFFFSSLNLGWLNYAASSGNTSSGNYISFTGGLGW